jgi:formylglycine-generating enzyme required for sulfatase activity
MKRYFYLIPIVAVALILSGCILSRTPSTNTVGISLGDHMTFSVKVFPSKATYSWTLDGMPLPNTGNSFIYTAQTGQHSLTVRATHSLGTDTQSWTIVTFNSPPVASAGPDQTVSVNAAVTLNGSTSTDPENDIVLYQWQQTGGPTVALNNASTAIADFTASVPTGSTLTFSLTVTDAEGLHSTDTCSVTVQQLNHDPVASAGPDQTVSVNATVTLNGSGSTDVDNNIVSYHWQQTGEPPYVSLVNADLAIAHFSTSVPIGSVLTFELTVTDATGLQSKDTCVVTVSVVGSPIYGLLNSMVYIPAGTFMMGSEDDEYGYTSPIHQVTLQGFGIGAYEVTQAQYEAVMGVNPSYHRMPYDPQSGNRPVDLVTWDNAREFCTALSSVTGRTFTLPSEAQWEYTCRAESNTLFSFGDDDSLLGNYAWYELNSGNWTHYVGTKLPNAWGLYDMHGNVVEWCLDTWHENYTGAPTDGSAWEPDAGVTRVLRGGEYCFSASDLRSAYRRYSHQYSSTDSYGFRIVEILP